MIDPSIITRGAEMAQLQQRQNMDALADLGGNLGQLVLGRRINQMRQLKTPEEQQAFANNSIFSPMLNTQLTADRSAAAKAANDQLKFNADLAETYGKIGKLSSESGEIDAKTGKLTTETGITRQNNAASIWNVYLKGGAGAAKAVLEGMKARGLIDDTNYQAELAALTDLDGKTAAEQQQYALGRYKGVQDAKYSLTTEDNVLDNAQSDKNSQRAYEASIYGADKDYQLGQQELQVKQALEQQKIDLEQNKGEIVTGADGMAYIFMPNQPPDESYKPLLGPDGKHAKAPAANSGKGGMSPTAQKELFEVTDSISAAQNGIENLRAALNYSKTAYDGFGATQRAAVAGNFTDSEAATATAMLNNIVTGNALEMLKATFGGAPTEGERAILLQLQGSANLPRAQREAIYNRAIQMAERRLQSNQAKAEGIRNGSYFQSQQGGGGSGGASLSYFK